MGWYVVKFEAEDTVEAIPKTIQKIQKIVSGIALEFK